MPKYAVSISRTEFLQLEVKAKNVDEAYDKAWDNIDDAEYTGSGESEITSVYEEKP